MSFNDTVKSWDNIASVIDGYTNIEQWWDILKRRSKYSKKKCPIVTFTPRPTWNGLVFESGFCGEPSMVAMENKTKAGGRIKEFQTVCFLDALYCTF